MGTAANEDTDLQRESPRMASHTLGADEERDCCPSTGRRGSVRATRSQCDVREYSRHHPLFARRLDFGEHDQAERTRLPDLLGSLPEAKSGVPAATSAPSPCCQRLSRGTSRLAVQDLTPPARTQRFPG